MATEEGPGRLATLNGVQIYFEVHGAAGGTGEPLLLLHGFSGSSQDWKQLTTNTWDQDDAADILALFDDLLHMATRQPERVKAMVLASATPYFPRKRALSCASAPTTFPPRSGNACAAVIPGVGSGECHLCKHPGVREQLRRHEFHSASPFNGSGADSDRAGIPANGCRVPRAVKSRIRTPASSVTQ